MAPPNAVANPPPLPPSVEEAYRRKCIQLKQRMNEVEESNDAARVRLIRTQRAIEKLRLERAFLLEQVAKRTSTNVEDSEGSPSPPPTSANANAEQPKEKPLRTKRGHRKPSFLNNIGDGHTGGTFTQHGPVTLSPSSDAFSHNQQDRANPPRNSTPAVRGSKRQLLSTSNGHANPSNLGTTPPTRRPKNAFDVYCSDLRSVLSVTHRKGLADGTYDLERGLAEGWRGLDVQQKDEFQNRFEKLKKGWETDKEASPSGARQPEPERATPTPVPASSAPAEDEDVEMAEGAGSPGAASGADTGGFTAVNRA